MKNNFTKGQKVWCQARVSILLGFRNPMPGTIKYRLPKLLKFFVALFIVYDTKGDFYCVKMQDGKYIFYSEKVITEINAAIEIAERLWRVNAVCLDSAQLPAHRKLIFWYENMLKFNAYTKGYEL